jgi:hypothetical protein
VPISRVELTTYAPDADENNPAILTGGASLAVNPTGPVVQQTWAEGTYNVFPTVKGFKTLPTPTKLLPKPTGATVVQGAFFARYLDSTTRFFAGTDTKLWEGIILPGSSATQWTEVGRTAAYATADDDRWVFAQFGNETLAVNGKNILQRITVSGTDFDDADSSAPKAKCIAVANNFVVLGNLKETAGYDGSWVWVSGVGTSQYWTTGDQKLSENFALSDSPGDIVALRTLGRDVLAYKKNATHLLSFSGSGWTNSLLSAQAGAVSDGAVVDVGDRHIVMGEGDFYEFSGGGAPSAVPNPVREFLFSQDGDLNRDKMHRVQGRFDRARNTVFWHYPSKDTKQLTLDYCDRWVAWNIGTDRWAIGQEDVAAVIYPEFDENTSLSYGGFGSTTAFNDDSANPTWGTNFKKPESASGAGDLLYNDGAIVGTSNLTQGFFRYAVTDTSTTLDGAYAFTDDNNFERKASIQTGDFGDGVIYKFIRRIRPRFVGPITHGTATLYAFSRNDLDGPVTGSLIGSISLDSNSPRWFSLRANARYHKFGIVFEGGSELSGFDIDYEDAGIR